MSVATSRLTPEEWASIDKTYAETADYSRPIVLFELPMNKVYIADGDYREVISERMEENIFIEIPYEDLKAFLAAARKKGCCHFVSAIDSEQKKIAVGAVLSFFEFILPMLCYNDRRSTQKSRP